MSISRSRFTIGLAILVAIAGCNDAGQGPLAPRAAENRTAAPPSMKPAGADLPVLRQSPTAPPLETYQVSFWAVRGKDTDIQVNYRAIGKEKPRPFLRLRIRKNSMEYSASGAELEKKDSVYMTLTIDPVAFDVHFATSGVQFAPDQPAELTMWYGNANMDLNGDGVVDAADKELLDHLALVNIAPEKNEKLNTAQQADAQSINATLVNYTQYAVSW